MNEHQTIFVLKLRLELTGETYRPATVTAWNEALNDLDIEEAERATRELARLSKDITVPAIRDWLRTERHRRRNYESSQQGTGLKSEDFAIMDPDAVAARREWWHNGRIGHYPDCRCETCAKRVDL